MEKKKIAVVFNRMIVGGAEKSLLNFLKAIDREKYEVTLFTLNDKGAYFDEIPENVLIKFTECKNTKELLLNNIRTFRLFSVFKTLIYRVMIRLSRDSYKRFTYSLMCYSKFPEKYDCAISYKFGYEDSATTLVRINADKKCVFLHSSPDNVKNQVSAGEMFGKIFIVSAGSKQQFDNQYPWLANKTQVFYNLYCVDDIRKKAEMKITDIDRSDQDIVLVTVGRLSKEKGQLLIPKAAKLLTEAGYCVKWYLVGDGDLRGEIEQTICKENVEDCVFLLGTKDNPYPYIKACDIYVQTSYSEGYCTTTVEAKVLHKPVVTTDAPGMQEQFINGVNGLIVPINSEALFEGIKKLIDYPELQEKFVRNLENEECSSSKELQKLYNFIEN